MLTIAVASTALGFLPLAWLAFLKWGRGHTINAAYWWLAVALGVSGVVDTLGWFVPKQTGALVSDLYPITQSAIIAAVFLTLAERWIIVAYLVLAGFVSVLISMPGRDVLLATVGWGAVSGIVLDRWALGRLRTALLISFGGIILPWWWYCATPEEDRATKTAAWLVFQSVRAIGTAWFCYAAWKPGPVLLIAKGR